MHPTNESINGHQVFIDDCGQEFTTDDQTGEVLPVIQEKIISGSRIITPQQQRAYKQIEEAKTIKYLSRMQGDELGNFYFAHCRDLHRSIKPQNLARLLFLATYLRHGSNLLYLTERTPMKKTDVQKVLHLTNDTFYRFWKSVSGEFIKELDTGEISMLGEFFRNRLPVQKTDSPTNYQKVYIAALRQLYQQTPATSHRYLGYVFLLLRYINFEFNILCHNPEEECLDNLNLMSLNELCDAIGYDKSKRLRLMDIYEQITFDWQGERQRFFSFVSTGRDITNARIFVNPHILYRGGNWMRVEVLGVFFDSQDKNRNAIIEEITEK